jgi:predicted GNAT superfamily acetyltransferase
MTNYPIRPLTQLNEMPPAVALQSTYWGDMPEAVIPAHMLYSIVANGGNVLGAYDGRHLAGVVIGFIGLDDDGLYIYSKRMVVDPAYRNAGLGFRLKMAQRDEARQRGIERVQWTFDPLLSPNAHLNIRKLGGVASRYVVDYYGTDNTGGLSPDGTSDRLIVAVWVNAPHVIARANGDMPTTTWAGQRDAGAVMLNTPQGTFAPPPPDATHGLLEIPADVRSLPYEDALAWRLNVREACTALMTDGWQITDFVTDAGTDSARRSAYVLMREA